MSTTDTIFLKTDAWSFESPERPAAILLDAALTALGVVATSSTLVDLARHGSGNVFLFRSSIDAHDGLAFDTCNVDGEQHWLVTFAIRYGRNKPAVAAAFHAFFNATNIGYYYAESSRHPEVMLRFDENAYPLEDGQCLVKIVQAGT